MKTPVKYRLRRALFFLIIVPLILALPVGGLAFLQSSTSSTNEGLHDLDGNPIASTTDVLAPGTKVAFVTHFATTCRACHEMLRNLSMVNTRGGAVGVVAVSWGSKRSEVKKFVQDYGLRFPVLVESNPPPDAVPHTFVLVWHEEQWQDISEGGFSGAIPTNKLQDLADGLLAEVEKGL